MTPTPDVLIVGAGPAGSGLAYFLAGAGLHVLLVDKAGFPRDKTCGDGLTPRALGVLRHMSLLDVITAAGNRINGVDIYAPDGRRVSAPIPACGDLPQFAVVLPRFQLDDRIRQHAVQAGAWFWPRVEVTDLIVDGGRCVGVRARGPDGPLELRARWVVLATGAALALPQRAGLLAERPAFGRAARTYYEGMAGLTDSIEFHLETVPLPGYAWVFPLSSTAANVGAGYLARPGQPAMRGSPRQVMDDFLAHPLLASRVSGARATAPVKGYPLRFDFPTAELATPGLAVVGEAAGLVNPLTGEGIDYALESAEVAAEVLSTGLRRGDAPAAIAATHTRAMRARFLRAFNVIARVRDFYFRPWLLNRAAATATRHADFRVTLIQVCLGNINPAQGLSPRMLWQLVRG